jgi:hypothetical protein
LILIGSLSKPGSSSGCGTFCSGSNTTGIQSNVTRVTTHFDEK